ncbi:hypothetical protein PPTG_13024 [Phytophthora nicotianae INRA-310]|uniref:Cilia- and flagella-associated protein 157 n=1 Tax=Phytophthora nicotianae (strain INRA-310) TaxID=761204 RepID=W2Q3A6_PHYN3|nr:hypothetical protein PPTG_13024 [Phytophthora nicotianae INRA-310]ETN07688.1 hypothetical protein PPTG_13024 [Phytophthora nicotianae INRA-310]
MPYFELSHCLFSKEVMDLVTSVVPVNDDGPPSETAGGVTHSILSQAVLDAISHMDSKLAFDMMLVNEHLNTQDTANRSLNEEVSFLKQTLAKQTREQSEMFHYFHDKTDEHVARIAELEQALADAQEEKEKLLETSREILENEQQERASELSKAQQEVAIVKEELRQVHAFAQAKRELEAHTRALETKLDAQRAAFQTQMQDLERHNLLEQARSKQELLGRMQAAKAELMLRTNDQVASTTHRTLLENEHFTHELAFQSRETEKLLERLDEAQQEVAKLRAQNKILEENEHLMAKKNRYYQKILAKLQQDKTADANNAVQLQIGSLTAIKEDIFEEEKAKVTITLPENSSVSSEEKEKRLEIETQLQRAMEWLRVFQRERQFILAQQDEVIQFLYRSLDEATEARRRSYGRSESTLNEINPSLFGAASKRVEELIQLAPSTTTMEMFGRRVLTSRPALDELSSEDAHEVLLFLLEKLRLYQVRIAAVYPNTSNSNVTSPVKQTLERQLGVELPPITSPPHSSQSPSSIKQKRRVFAHVAAAVDAGNTEWLKPNTVYSHPQAPLSPQLLAMATNQFNFISQTVQKSPTKRRHQQLKHSSLGKNHISPPSRKVQTQIHPLISCNKDEMVAPWVGTSSTASIVLWNQSGDTQDIKN